jgi:2-iminobutanoate/2-iminopropanoate deaminase
VAEVVSGKLVYTAGQVAVDPSGNLVGKDDFRKQVRQVFENLKSAVEAAGGTFNNIIKLNYNSSTASSHLSLRQSGRFVTSSSTPKPLPPARLSLSKDWCVPSGLSRWRPSPS